MLKSAFVCFRTHEIDEIAKKMHYTPYDSSAISLRALAAITGVLWWMLIKLPLFYMAYWTVAVGFIFLFA